VRGYGFQVAPRAGIGAAARGTLVWREFKNALLKSLGPWGFGMGGWGECLPRHDNYVALHPTLKDKWGISGAAHPMHLGPNELAILKDIQGQQRRS